MKLKQVRFIVIPILLFSFILGTQCLKAQDRMLDDLMASKIDTYLSQSVTQGFSGSVLIAEKGQVVLSKGYGWSDRDKKILNAPSTVFNIGSVTKQFTAAGILKLVEQRKLKTSDPIKAFFPEAPEDKGNITLHQLLTHTSGISPQTGGFRYNEASKAQFLNEFFTSTLETQPGTRHHYANANYIMLAAIIETASGQSYADFLRANFWNPLGMKHTGYKSIGFNSEQLAHGYYFDISDGYWKDWGITQEHLPYNENHWYSIGKGDVYSTVEDLYQWHRALQTNQVLSEKSHQLLETPFVKETEAGTSHYGYGWAIFTSQRGTKIVAHDGSNGIYFANFIRFVDDDVVVIVLENTITGPDSENMAWTIGNMIFDADYQPKAFTKSSYEWVYDFTRAHAPEEASQLLPFLEKKLDGAVNDKSLFNRLGFKILAKEKEPGWGLELLKLNVQLFPDDGNLWDSLGEAYFQYQQNEDAASSFKKALELKPDADCHWCENSSKRLKELTQNN